jgi:acyl-CoA hydrolase
MDNQETYSHRLILPADSNHHGTLYAGALLRIALESAYACAFRLAGPNGNLLLRRVLSIECYHPVPVGTVIQIRARGLFLTRAYLVVGLLGEPLTPGAGPWMDGLMGFVSIDEEGKPTPLPEELQLTDPSDEWADLKSRLESASVRSSRRKPKDHPSG